MSLSTKERVLAALSESRESISGQKLAMKLNVTRSSIWKAIEALRADGCEINAVTNRGYRLVRSADRLDGGEISRLGGGEVTVFDSVGSTNTIAKEQAALGARHGSVYIAAHQSAGRGRRGRKFASAGDGIYMSIILRPESDYSHAPLVTAAAAVAVREAIAAVCAKECGIKWVNDLFLNGKKVCGILTEAVTDMESGAIDSVIVGIGINFRGGGGDVPEELKDISGFLYENEAPPVTRNVLAAEVIKNMLRLSGELGERRFIESYRAHSTVIGQRIEYRLGAELVTATALGIDGNCALEVVRDDGVHEFLSAGEVSVRKPRP